MSLPIRKLGLGGGGMKGILHIGALRELSKHQELHFSDGIYGISIGSVIATYVAFGLPIDHTTTPLIQKYMTIDRVIPKLTFKDISTAFATKGLFDMNTFKVSLIEMFDEAGLDIRDKKLKDAKMPLYIIASNITKGCPSILSKNVSVVDAILCSCCIPGVFKPQMLEGQLYIDGGLFLPCLSTIIPDAVVLSLMKRTSIKLTQETIQSVNTIQFMNDLYSMASNWLHERYKTDLTVCLSYKNLTTDSDLNEFDIDDILQKSGNQLLNFLRTKNSLEECTECLR